MADRRYRDMFKGVSDANTHLGQYFVGQGLKQMQDSYVLQSWEGNYAGRPIKITLTNIGKWEVTSSHLDIFMPLQVEGLAALGAYVPFLLRVGLKHFQETDGNGIHRYVYDEKWGPRLFSVCAETGLTDRLGPQDFLVIEPGKMSCKADIKDKNDDWITEQLAILSRLADRIEQLPAGPKVQPSFVRRNITAISTGLGILGAIVLLALLIAIGGLIF